MKIIHIADLHLGQEIYQHYKRKDEHAHFFDQLETLCREEKPDALCVAGDVFDIAQPSIDTWSMFDDRFVRLHQAAPEMALVITSGNHDSSTRLASNSRVWSLANAHIVGAFPTAPIELPSGYIVPLPYLTRDKQADIQALLDAVAARNTEGKPVVLMAHQAVAGGDTKGHDEIGTLRCQELGTLGTGYDYLALGHLHRPQTLGRPQREDEEEGAPHADVVELRAPVARYAGSALHVSDSEAYPHTISIVEMDHHGGTVRLREKRIDELRHFYLLPLKGEPFTDAQSALKAIEDFAEAGRRGYIRLRVAAQTNLPTEFNQKVYDKVESYGDELRYNPRFLWEGEESEEEERNKHPQLRLEEIQQIENPIVFIEKIIHRFEGLEMDDVNKLWGKVEEEVRRISDVTK